MNKWFVFPMVSRVSCDEDGDFGSLVFYDREENKMEFQYYGKKEKMRLMGFLVDAYYQMKGKEGEESEP